MKARFIARFASIFGAIVTLGFLVYAGRPSTVARWMALAAFGSWCVLPYGMVFGFSRRFADSPASQVPLAVAAAIVTLPVPFLFYDAFVVNTGSTNALLFLFIPLYQLVVVVPAVFLARRSARRTTNR